MSSRRASEREPLTAHPRLAFLSCDPHSALPLSPRPRRIRCIRLRRRSVSVVVAALQAVDVMRPRPDAVIAPAEMFTSRGGRSSHRSKDRHQRIAPARDRAIWTRRMSARLRCLRSSREQHSLSRVSVTNTVSCHGRRAASRPCVSAITGWTRTATPCCGMARGPAFRMTSAGRSGNARRERPHLEGAATTCWLGTW